MKNKNSVFIGLLVLGFLGIFLVGVQFNDLFTGNVARGNELGNLEIISFPSGVNVNYKMSKSNIAGFGVTPFTVALPQGTYSLTLKKESYDDYNLQIPVIGGRTTIERIEMQPSGEIYITSNPSKANVKLYRNGVFYGKGITPFGNKVRPKKIPSGSYKVVFEKKGYKGVTKNIDVNDKDLAYMHVDLEIDYL